MSKNLQPKWHIPYLVSKIIATAPSSCKASRQNTEKKGDEWKIAQVKQYRTVQHQAISCVLRIV